MLTFSSNAINAQPPYLGVDDEESAVSNAKLRDEDAVPRADLLGGIGEDRDLMQSGSSGVRRVTEAAISLQILYNVRQRTCMKPSPPRLRGVLIQARWHSSVSVEAAISWQPSASNSLARSLKAMISVGQTKVKSLGLHERNQNEVFSLTALKAKKKKQKAIALKLTRRRDTRIFPVLRQLLFSLFSPTLSLNSSLTL